MLQFKLRNLSIRDKIYPMLDFIASHDKMSSQIEKHLKLKSGNLYVLILYAWNSDIEGQILSKKAPGPAHSDVS